MKYTAEITKKEIGEGKLTIHVVFKSLDGSKTVRESFTIRSKQDDNWFTDAISRKIKELEELDDFTDLFEVGEVVIDPNVVVVEPDNPKKQYKKDLERFNKLVQILRQGFIEQDHVEFVALQQKLKDDFSIDYIDLF